MSGSVSPVSVMRVRVVLFHVSLVGEPGDEKPEANGPEDSLPDGLGHLVPHLIVEQMDLLETSNVIFLAWSVGEGPNSQIVHMSHLGPSVLELNTVSDHLVLETGLSVVPGRSQQLLEILGLTLHVCKLIHFNK